MAEFFKTLNVVDYILIVFLCTSLIAIFLMLIKNIFRYEDFDLNDFYIPIIILTISIEILGLNYKYKKDTALQKSPYEYYEYYELKLSDDTIIRDSLQENNDYFYNDKGERYYKSNIIYSKKLNE